MPEHLDPRNDPDSQRGPGSHPGGRACTLILLAAIVLVGVAAFYSTAYVLAAQLALPHWLR